MRESGRPDTINPGIWYLGGAEEQDRIALEKSLMGRRIMMLWVTAVSPISRLRVIGVRREGRTQMERPQRISRVPCFIREAVNHALP